MAGFGNIMFFQLILFPVMQRMLKSKDQPLLKAAAVFVAFVSVSIGMEVQSWEPNYFSVLGVARDASNGEIKKAFREASKLYHPDVNDSPDAEDKMVLIGKIKEAFSNPKDRRVYDRFGEHFFSSPNHDQWLEQPGSMLFYHLSFYGSAIFLTYVLTFEESRQRARNWCFFLLGVMGFYELMAKYDDADWDFFSPILPTWTLYEKIEVYHSIVFYVFHLFAQYASLTYIDIQQLHFMRIHSELAAIMQSVERLEEDMEHVAKRKGGDNEGVSDGATLARKRKAEARKQQHKHGVQQAAVAQQQKGGTNWLSLAITAFFIYQWWTGK